MHTVRMSLAALVALGAIGCGVDTNNNSSVKISSISPDTGSITGGTEVQIGGKGFDGGNDPTVVFGVNEAIVTNFSDNQISAILPAGNGCGNVDLQINNSNGFAIDENAFTYTGGSGVLTVTQITPALGDIAGDTEVVITGSGFTGGAGVLLSGIPLLDITVETDTQIRARTPPVPTGGIKDLQVRNCADEVTLEGAFMFTSDLNGGYVEIILNDYLNPAQYNDVDYLNPLVAFVEPTTESLLNPTPTMDLCVYNPPDLGAGDFTIIDAGPEVALSSGAQTMTLELKDDGLYYYDANDSESTQTAKFVFNAAYTLSGSGNATTPAFTAPLATTPADFTVSAPDIDNTRGAIPVVQRNQNLSFTWNGSQPGDFMQIILVGYANDDGLPTDEYLVCTVLDDGGFQIPGVDMNKFTTATGQIGVNLVRRKDTPFIVPFNGSRGVAVSLIYKKGLLYFP